MTRYRFKEVVMIIVSQDKKKLVKADRMENIWINIIKQKKEQKKYYKKL